MPPSSGVAAVHEPVPGAQHPGAPAHLQPALPGHLRGAGLAQGHAVEVEHRVAAEHQGAAPEGEARPPAPASRRRPRPWPGPGAGRRRTGRPRRRPRPRRPRPPRSPGPRARRPRRAAWPGGRGSGRPAPGGASPARCAPRRPHAHARARRSVSSPTEPRSSARRCQAVRSNCSPSRGPGLLAQLQPGPLADLVRRRLAGVAQVAVELEAERGLRLGDAAGEVRPRLVVRPRATAGAGRGPRSRSGRRCPAPRAPTRSSCEAMRPIRSPGSSRKPSSAMSCSAYSAQPSPWPDTHTPSRR